MRKNLLLTSVAILNTMASIAVPTVVSASTTDSTATDTNMVATSDQDTTQLDQNSDSELVANNNESKDNNILAGSKKAEPDQNVAHSFDAESLSDDVTPMSRMAPSAFINLAGPMAQRSAQRYNVYASVMMAQAIIESGWGGSTLAMYPNHNLFGIKGSYNGQSVYMPTREYSSIYGWYTINAAFRKYPSYEQSFDDNGSLLRYGLNGYYKGTWKENTNSYRDATRWLQGRYATAPNYAAVLNNTIQTYNLTRFDNPTQGPGVDAGSQAPLNGDFFKMDDQGVITNPKGAQIYHQANPDRPENQILASGSSWKTTGKVVTSKGEIFYQVSTTQYIKADDIKLKSDVSDDTKQRVIKAKNPNSSIVPLIGFKDNGKAFDGNRGLANDTLWITDQTREYQGHKYYRVSTNEWVQDSHATFIK